MKQHDKTTLVYRIFKTDFDKHMAPVISRFSAIDSMLIEDIAFSSFIDGMDLVKLTGDQL